MNQSLSATKCVYQLGHKGIQTGLGAVWDNPLWGKLGVAAFDLLMPGRPFGTAWMHEEWHRAVMTVRRIESYNEVYDFKFFGGVIRVSHVTDADLERLKTRHNADVVRLAAAGIESLYELNTALEKDAFFRGTTVFNEVLLWLNTIGGVAYVASHAMNTPDQFEQEAHPTEHAEHQKDFVGHDVTGWAYDLFRPHEPYAARGLHPGGAGVDRYIGRADLTGEERRYLGLQSGLSLLNFADPFLFGKTHFTSRIGGTENLWNVTLRHHLTSFGSAVDANVFLKSRVGLFFVVHSYYNRDRPYFGLESAVVDYELAKSVYSTARAMVWQQPRDQAFRTLAGIFGGLVSVRAATPLVRWLRAYVEVEAKSAGWVAGNPYLDGALSTRVGMESRF